MATKWVAKTQSLFQGDSAIFCETLTIRATRETTKHRILISILSEAKRSA